MKTSDLFSSNIFTRLVVALETELIDDVCENQIQSSLNNPDSRNSETPDNSELEKKFGVLPIDQKHPIFIHIHMYRETGHQRPLRRYPF